jgi:prevent-host-death family protein
MATDVPQRELRNRTADLLRRVEAGERLRITVHGHPVAELVPIEDEYPYPLRTFVPLKEIMEGLAGSLHPGDQWAEEIRELRNSDRLVRGPFEVHEKRSGEERTDGSSE